LFFGHVTDEHGEQAWHTCVYHDESGEQKVIEDAEPVARENFAGVATDPWVDWIREQAKLPTAAKPIPAEIEAVAPPAPVSPYDVRIEILDVQVSVVGPSPPVREKRLTAEIRFQMSGPERDTVTESRIPFRVEVHTVDLESRASNLVASWPSELRPEVFEYTTHQEFPIPELGRHELHSVVLLHPPGAMMAYHLGPIINVIP
jgi:hypothetical protein